jgi:hypothetical protein
MGAIVKPFPTLENCRRKGKARWFTALTAIGFVQQLQDAHGAIHFGHGAFSIL